LPPPPPCPTPPEEADEEDEEDEVALAELLVETLTVTPVLELDPLEALDQALCMLETKPEMSPNPPLEPPPPPPPPPPSTSVIPTPPLKSPETATSSAR
jgi:hypothetical protein